jgi:histidine ammonia-lyase
MPDAPYRFDGSPVRIEDMTAIGLRGREVAIGDDPAFRERIERGMRFLEELIREDGRIYGVTTGFGDSCTRAVPPHLIAELPTHLHRFHNCALGEYFPEPIARTVIAVRITSLARGFSGIGVSLLERLALLLNRGIIPLIPEEGSVGASGDLTPLSYLAAVLAGESRAWHNGRACEAAEIFLELGITPYAFRPKEALAVMNGTAVMTALACVAWERAEYLMRLCTRLTSFVSAALKGNRFHFDAPLFSVKPHAGQIETAARIRSDLGECAAPHNSDRLQDRYSLRCAPHIIGVLADALPWFRYTIENELNSANDNPIIDAEGRRVLHGGHFYGGHIALAMDALKPCVANLADLMDRQMALLVDVKYNNGLPANLSGASGERAAINHGFKAVQIGMSAWTAEALKLTMPASVFSRSTECHNQDKVSMGTHAARDCLRILTLAEQTASGLALAATQAFEIRTRRGEIKAEDAALPLLAFHADIMKRFALVEEDRPLEEELRAFMRGIEERRWALYAPEEALP